MPSLYVVIAVDAEGPLNEKLSHTFERINDYFGVKIKPTLKNLNQLKTGNFNFSKKDKKFKNRIQEILKPHYLNTYKNWNELNKANKYIFSNKFRKQYKDSANNSIILDWYCLDHVNFIKNPRSRDIGHHKIFNKYEKFVKNNSYGDQLQWHFHPIPFNKKATTTGNNISFTNSHIEILTRKIIDKNWFPSSFRPTSSIRTDLNVFLEQWIPFDLSNSNIERYNIEQNKHKRLTSVYGLDNDSRGSTTDWSIYNPSLLDVRKKGTLKRYIGRCLNILSYNLSINENEIKKAFKRSKKQNTLLSVTLHDFRNINKEIEYLASLINKVSMQYKNQNFYWSNSVNAFRKCIGLKKNKIEIKLKINSNILYIKSKFNIWGMQPFLAIKTNNNKYLHDNLIPDDSKNWRYSFDIDTIEIKDVNKIGIAFNDLSGSTAVYVANLSKKEIKWTKTIYN